MAVDGDEPDPGAWLSEEWAEEVKRAGEAQCRGTNEERRGVTDRVGVIEARVNARGAPQQGPSEETLFYQIPQVGPLRSRCLQGQGNN